MEPTIKLRNGIDIPRLGLGVWKTAAEETRNVVSTAINVGYRHFDTAMIYGNEQQVGEAIKECGLPRKTLFVTTKLWTDDHGASAMIRAFDASFRRLNIGYIDLYLSHFPVQGKREDTWRAMQELMQTGRCRGVGVSNYTVRHLQDLIDRTAIVPAINQVEFHPFLYQKDLLEFCRNNRIVVEAYSPLIHGQRHDNPLLKSIAKAHGKTVSQILIRWCLQHETVVIPKTTKKERMIENLSVFDFQLTTEEMTHLNGLNENYRTCWDPTKTP